jgi:GNAT superfamily N-acetyltransferase
VTNHVQFLPIDLEIHRSQLLDLNVEYMDWAAKQILENYNIDIFPSSDISMRQYLSNSIDKLCSDVPPEGIYFLVQYQNEFVGMGCLHKLREDVAEVKRMYIRPKNRGKGYGKALLQELLLKAKQFGYQSIYLDSGKFMKDAHQLYYSQGFVDREEYAESEIPPPMMQYWIFMEKTLQDS